MMSPTVHGSTLEPHAAGAVATIARQLGDQDLDSLFLFCSSHYDLATVARELQRTFPCPIVGCSSAGQIGPGGFQRGGMSALGFRRGYLTVVPHLIHPLSDYQTQVLRIASALQAVVPSAKAKAFGFLLIDGLSMMEERVASALYQALDRIPVIGGSAGDDLCFTQTKVYFEGQFLSDAAVLAACVAKGPIAPFMMKHFVPGPVKLVITESTPERRIIQEINGEPAAQAYAEAIGVELEALDPVVFSQHPLLLGISGEHYVRSIEKVNEDLSLTMYCAIETGLVVSVGRSVDPREALLLALEGTQGQVADPFAILACDCILRRLEFEHLGTDDSIGRLMANNHLFGFSTYGEQFNGLHVNQTLTGIALGRPHGV